MAALIAPMLKYSVVNNVLNSWPILIQFVSKFMVFEALYFTIQYALRLRPPLRRRLHNTYSIIVFIIYRNKSSFEHLNRSFKAKFEEIVLPKIPTKPRIEKNSNLNSLRVLSISNHGFKFQTGV